MKKISLGKAVYLRAFTFGVEDSLVSTVGLLSGIAMAGVSRANIFVTGVILIFVEAVSMGAGNFLSEKTAAELAAQRRAATQRSLMSGGVMFLSYFVAGFIPLAPYIFYEKKVALTASIFCSLFSLLILGIINAQITRTSFWRSSLRMVLVGGAAIVVGVVVGHWIN